MCNKDLCSFVGMVYDTRRLTGVSTTSLRVARVLHMVSNLAVTVFTGVCGLGVQVYGTWCMWT
jgi:hypothetical protein